MGPVLNPQKSAGPKRVVIWFFYCPGNFSRIGFGFFFAFDYGFLSFFSRRAEEDRGEKKARTFAFYFSSKRGFKGAFRFFQNFYILILLKLLNRFFFFFGGPPDIILYKKPFLWLFFKFFLRGQEGDGFLLLKLFFASLFGSIFGLEGFFEWSLFFFFFTS